ncbi:MAG: dephospho-CoA kinase [Burkholderiales bacterium]|jgi:dephospho-CoA kinase|nr:dephospho-CoA kinase [Burkholderiales bacterium]
MTGGIGSGKSTAAELFQSKGAFVLDADDLSREVSSPGGAAYPKLVELLGNEYFLPDKTLDRAKVRALVFESPHVRQRMEAIIHPRVAALARERFAHAKGAYGIYVAPLLLEAKSLSNMIKRVLVVDCDEETQRARVMATRGLSQETVALIMQAQLSRQERLRHADDIIDNSGTRDHLLSQVTALDRVYRQLAFGKK